MRRSPAELLYLLLSINGVGALQEMCNEPYFLDIKCISSFENGDVYQMQDLDRPACSTEDAVLRGDIRSISVVSISFVSDSMDKLYEVMSSSSLYERIKKKFASRFEKRYRYEAGTHEEASHGSLFNSGLRSFQNKMCIEYLEARFERICQAIRNETFFPYALEMKNIGEADRERLTLAFENSGIKHDLAKKLSAEHQTFRAERETLRSTGVMALSMESSERENPCSFLVFSIFFEEAGSIGEGPVDGAASTNETSSTNGMASASADSSSNEAAPMDVVSKFSEAENARDMGKYEEILTFLASTHAAPLQSRLCCLLDGMSGDVFGIEVYRSFCEPNFERARHELLHFAFSVHSRKCDEQRIRGLYLDFKGAVELIVEEIKDMENSGSFINELRNERNVFSVLYSALPISGKTIAADWDCDPSYSYIGIGDQDGSSSSEEGVVDTDEKMNGGSLASSSELGQMPQDIPTGPTNENPVQAVRYNPLTDPFSIINILDRH
jgi:hypothetical protein